MDTGPIKKSINEIFERKRAAVLAIAKNEAALALQEFQQNQPATPGAIGKYWTNRTAQAAARVYADAYIDDEVVAWFIAHGVFYGVFLELANDRMRAALKPIIEAHLEPFKKKVEQLYAD